MNDLEGEYNVHVRKMIGEFSGVARSILRDSVYKAGLYLTGDLKNQIKVVANFVAERYEGELVFEFKQYMRYKDMKTLTYLGYTNTNAIKVFVEKVGLENFAYVSGYKGSPETIANAKSKIAWAIIKSRGTANIIYQKESKRPYNKAKMVILNKIIRDIRQLNVKDGLSDVKKILSALY
jgi:hypothetical protein